ncbi:MAG: DUF2029 domain-containing protein [Anaerolineales bacterium]|nr:DUF2029 domain-containing protein [Anaerolineales bacterium]
MFKDLDIFLRAAATILQGNDPYSIPNLEVFYPLPFYFLFIPLAALPPPLVYALWSALSASVLIAILRRRVVWVALAMPVLLTFLLGQVDIVVMALYAALRSSIAAGVALAFLVLKPQLVLLLAPWMLWRWWRRERRQIVAFLIVLGALVALSFLVQPDWLARFFARSGERTRAAISSSVWGLATFLPAPLWLPVSALVVFGLVAWAWRKNNFDMIATVGLLTSPFVFSYNLMPLFVIVRAPVFLIALTIVSWVAFGISAIVLSDAASVSITVLALVAVGLQGNRSTMPHEEVRR